MKMRMNFPTENSSSLEQNEINLESKSNEISGKSRVVIVKSKNDRKIFGNRNQCLSLLTVSQLMYTKSV